MVPHAAAAQNVDALTSDMATRGRVDLDAPAARYLSGVVVDNPWSSDAPLLVRHLLDHTGGLERLCHIRGPELRLGCAEPVGA